MAWCGHWRCLLFHSFYIQSQVLTSRQCNKDGPDDRNVDILDLPVDGKLPQCWFGIEAKRMGIHSSCSGRCENPTIRVNYYGFGDGSEQSEGDDSTPEAPKEPEKATQGNTGCYNDGLSWSDMHGSGSETSVEEVKSDVFTRCQSADGVKLSTASDFWWDCTEVSPARTQVAEE